MGAGEPATTAAVEILVEPFREGRPGPHVQAAIDALTEAGLEVEVGPFSTTASGGASHIGAALGTLVPAAIAEGATRIQLQVHAGRGSPPPGEDLHGALQRLVAAVEQELGGRLGELPRAQKQAAVRLLSERGAFLLRRAVEDIAEAMGVSRITIYNYLNALDEA